MHITDSTDQRNLFSNFNSKWISDKHREMGRTIIKTFIWICFCLLYGGASAQYVYNTVYEPDFAGFSQMVEDVVSDEELNVYVVASHKASGISTYQIVKLDPSGNIVKRYTPPLNQNRQEGFQNSLIISNETLYHFYSVDSDSGICIEKLDPSLNLLKTWCFEAGSGAYASSVDIIRDSLIVVAYSQLEDDNENRDIHILVVNLNGQEKWRRVIGEPNMNEHTPEAIGFNDRIYLAYRNGTLKLEIRAIALQGFDIKTKSFPNHHTLLWARNQEEGNNIFGTISRGSFFEINGVGSLNLDPQSLDIISEQLHMGGGIFAQSPVLIGETLYFPSSGSDLTKSFMLVTDAITGDSLDVRRYEPDVDSLCFFKTIHVLENGQFILGGYTHETLPIGPRKMWLVKTDRWGCASELCLSTEEHESENPLNVFPNPAKHTISIEGLQNPVIYNIYSITGSKLQEGVVYPQESLDVSNLKSGIYFLQVEDGRSWKFVKR